GSLFTDEIKYWNVAELLLVRTRPLRNDSKISGVNMPYLYFRIWHATFAWNVENKDPFPINYIHFGNPKQYVPIPLPILPTYPALATDHTISPQFLRHNSFLASPTPLPVCPNVLVQHVGHLNLPAWLLCRLQPRFQPHLEHHLCTKKLDYTCAVLRVPYVRG
ncbi:hypothetical protein K439DRAFT_1348331, partial [Ramaria rubella]